jgi:hypothetical protein
MGYNQKGEGKERKRGVKKRTKMKRKRGRVIGNS